MKIFSIFITMLMFTAGFDLCSSDKLCRQEERIGLENNSGESQDTENSCSPFCLCSGCVFPVVLPARMNDQVFLNFSTEEMKNRSAFFPTGIDETIWQPPKCC